MSIGNEDVPLAGRVSTTAMMLRLVGTPSFWLVLFLIAVAVGLALPLHLPLGPNAWDTAVYLDAIHRIGLGQAPNLDFFTPVGPLGYYLAAAIQRIAPHAQPMLLANWAILPVLLPPMVLLAVHVEARSRPQALALLLPLLIFSALPINLHALNNWPGFDGYGHYNRHGALLLYVLIAALLFVRERRLSTGLVAALMLGLFLVKVTGAVAGAMLVGYAVLVGRLRLRDACIAAAVVLAALALVDLATGLVRAYVVDILALLSLNTRSLLSRVLTVALVKVNVLMPALLLLAALGAAAWRRGAMPERLRSAADGPLGWLAASLVVLTLYETQNTGSLEYIALWPVLLQVLLEWRDRPDRLRPVVLLLALAVALPGLVIYAERSIRALVGASYYVALGDESGPLGRVSVKRATAPRAAARLEHYAANRDSYRALAARDLMPVVMFYSELDYQAVWVLEAEQAVGALRRWEASSGRRLNGILSLDFADPLNRLLGRTPPRHVPIGLDPGRSNPPLSARALEALRATDAILAPLCPATPNRNAIAAYYAPALAGRVKVALAPCWEMWLRP